MSDTITREQVELLFDKLLDVEELDYQEQLALCRVALKSFDQPAPPTDVVLPILGSNMAKWVDKNLPHFKYIRDEGLPGIASAPPSTLMGMEVKFGDGLSGEQFFIQPSQPAPPDDVVEVAARAISGYMSVGDSEGAAKSAIAALRELGWKERGGNRWS